MATCGDSWWLVGFFESSWNAKFAVDVTVRNGKVYAHTDYAQRPPREWVEARAKAWGLKTFYTRLSPQRATAKILEAPVIKGALSGRKVLDQAAVLVDDTSSLVTWQFAFYVQEPNGLKSVAVIERATEGTTGEDYGFLDTTKPSNQISAQMANWIRTVAAEKNWKQATNLP